MILLFSVGAALICLGTAEVLDAETNLLPPDDTSVREWREPSADYHPEAWLAWFKVRQRMTERLGREWLDRILR